MTAPYRTRAFDAPVAPFHVVIIGGGIGGLTLAQGLKKAGVSVAVYERDRTRTDGLQGFRVGISPDGGRALVLRLGLHANLWSAMKVGFRPPRALCALVVVARDHCGSRLPTLGIAEIC